MLHGKALFSLVTAFQVSEIQLMTDLLLVYQSIDIKWYALSELKEIWVK